MTNNKKRSKVDTKQFEPFPKEWVEALQFVKHMRSELDDVDVKFSDFVMLFVHLTGGQKNLI